MATERKLYQVTFDVEAVERWQVKLQFTPSMLERARVMDSETYRRALKSGELRNDCLQALADFIGCERSELLPWQANQGNVKQQPFGLPSTEEWLVDGEFPASEWMKTANGLDYRICRMKHRTIENHFGRGKFYDLLSVRKELREKLKHRLERHAVVGMTITPCEWLPQFYSCVPAGTGEGWWVIDRWVGSTTLLEQIGQQTDANSPVKVPELLKGLLRGLNELHKNQIILRELHPRSIVIGEPNGSPVISDLEMAKLSDGLPTVKTEFLQHNPYRAPEVDSGQVSPATDLYSWAMVCLFVALRRDPLVHSLERDIAEAGFPDKVSTIIRQCLMAGPSHRPESCACVLKSLAKWS